MYIFRERERELRECYIIMFSPTNLLKQGGFPSCSLPALKINFRKPLNQEIHPNKICTYHIILHIYMCIYIYTYHIYNIYVISSSLPETHTLLRDAQTLRFMLQPLFCCNIDYTKGTLPPVSFHPHFSRAGSSSLSPSFLPILGVLSPRILPSRLAFPLLLWLFSLWPITFGFLG